MGKTKEQKQAMLAKLKQNLDESQLTLVINYQGLSVAEITDLRQRLIPTGSICSIAKKAEFAVLVSFALRLAAFCLLSLSLSCSLSLFVCFFLFVALAALL